MNGTSHGHRRALGSIITALGALVSVAVLLVAPATASASDPVVATVGDIACDPSSSKFNGGLGDPDECRQKYTSDLVVGAGVSRVLAIGDLQYDDGNYNDFLNSYDQSWGRVKSITSPVLGNHEPGSASGYFDYFNGKGISTGPAGQRGKGYYSYDVGSWHVIALNSNCDRVSCDVGSPQEQWLRADLAAHPDTCKLAYWHHPRFSSGHDGDNLFTQPLWQALYDARADILLSGHSHDYERFAPQDANGTLDRGTGIRQFIVGTGGAFFTGIGSAKPNSEVRQNHTYGVLFLTLRPSGYDWEFVPEAGKTFTDSGSGTCHRTGIYKVGAGLVTDGGVTTLSYLADTSDANDVSVTTSSTSYIITDRGVSTIVDADGAGGCTVAGNRAVCPSSGVDAIRVDVRDGNDAVAVGASKNATILGGPGADRLTGGDGADVLEGWGGNDRLIGGTDNDILDGGADDDILEGQENDDTLRGGTGVDTADYSSATSAVRVSLTTTSSQSTGGAGADRLSAMENLTGGAGNDTLTGDSAVNSLSGDGGDDMITSRDSLRDPVSCGSGADVVIADVQDQPAVDCERWDNGVPPDTTIVSGPSGTINSSVATFQFSSTEPGTFECRLDLGTWAWCSSPKTYTGLARGPHIFRVAAIDQFGNRDATEATRSWTAKFIPTASFTLSPALPLVNDSVTFNSTSTASGGDVIARHEWDLDGNGTFETDTGKAATASATYASAGAFDVSLRITDDDGDTAGTTQTVAVHERPASTPSLAGPPAPPAIVGGRDTRPPTVVVSGAASQKVGRRGRLIVFVHCDELCTVTASAAVAIQQASRVVRTSKTARKLAAGQKGKLALKFSKKALRAVRRAIGRRKRVIAKVKIVSKDQAGNLNSFTQKVQLRR